MKITLSKTQWENIGKKAGWMKTAQRIRYYLETWIDGKQMLGSDGTVVFLENKPSERKLIESVKNQTQKLIGLSKHIMPSTITNAENITLRFVQVKGTEQKTLRDFDITDSVKNNIEATSSKKTTKTANSRMVYEAFWRIKRGEKKEDVLNELGIRDPSFVAQLDMLLENNQVGKEDLPKAYQ